MKKVVTLFVFIILVVILVSCSRNKSEPAQIKPALNDTIDAAYTGLRELGFRANTNTSLSEYRGPVYSAVIDIYDSGEITTLICYIDGTASLIYSLGVGILGAGQSNEIIKATSTSLLTCASEIIDEMEIAETFDPPAEGHHCVYIISDNGTYKKDYDISNMDAESEEIQNFYSLYQKIIFYINYAAMSK